MALRTRVSTLFTLFALFALFAGVATAHAQAAANDEFSLDDEGADTTAATEPAPETTLLGDEQALQEERSPDERFRESTDPYEDPDKSYFFAGAAWRYVRLPAWVLETGLEAAPSVGTAGSFFGEFAYRNDGFQVTASVGWLGWNFKGPFQLAGDPAEDTEWLDAKFNFLVGTAAITWSTAFTDWFALEYGLEVGLGAIFGDLIRNEAYRDANGKWRPCTSRADINPVATAEERLFCEPPSRNNMTLPPSVLTNEDDELGAHYNVKAEKVPPVLPVLGPRLSARFKPIHQLSLRVDIPLPVLPFGFMGGLSAQYGF